MEPPRAARAWRRKSSRVPSFTSITSAVAITSPRPQLNSRRSRAWNASIVAASSVRRRRIIRSCRVFGEAWTATTDRFPPNAPRKISSSARPRSPSTRTRSPWMRGRVRSAQIPIPCTWRSAFAMPPTVASVIGRPRRRASSRTTSPMRTTEKPSVCATARASSFPQPGIPVRKTTRTGGEETDGSLNCCPRPQTDSVPAMLGLLTRTLGETHHPEAARETCRREQDRGDEDPLSPTRATERDRNQKKSDEPAGHRHFGEVEDRAVDELKFEQRLPGKCLEDSNRPCSKRNDCGGELDERDGPGCGVTEHHQTGIIPLQQSPIRRNMVARELVTQNRNTHWLVARNRGALCPLTWTSANSDSGPNCSSAASRRCRKAAS